MIQEFSLQYFRNHHKRQFLDLQQINIFVGANGSGKTNCLEALSFLNAGRGLRHAKLEEILPVQFELGHEKFESWGVQAMIAHQGKIDADCHRFSRTKRQKASDY